MKVKVSKIIDSNTFKASTDRLVKHSKYGKYIIRSKNYLVDSAGSGVGVGEEVEIKNSRPISKNKKWVIVTK